MGQNLTDQTNVNNKNQLINDLLRQATMTQTPLAPRFLGAKRLKQALGKTAERISPLKWQLQGDGATEDLEILVAKAVKEVLHRGGYDSSFAGKQGIVDRILRNGDAYRLIFQQDPDKTAFPVGFKLIDQNNIFVSTSATTFRGGNKNVTHLVALFAGTVEEFKEAFPEYKDSEVRPGTIPKNTTSFKDLDQTYTQKLTQDNGSEDQELMDWAYSFCISPGKMAYRLFAGGDLSILESENEKDYSWKFENLEGKEEPYIPVANYMCIPAVEGIFNDGLGAYLYDLCIVFRQVLNMTVGHVQENAYPHTLINLPQDQLQSFFGLVRMADQLRNAGERAYIPVGYNPNQQGVAPSASAILNGGRMDEASSLLALLDDEFRKCGVYLDEPVDPSVTATQVKLNASNALVLPKSIMKVNASEIEFEVMVAIDMIKKYVNENDETPLILDTTIELPDGNYSIRGVPFTLGWLAGILKERQWRVVTDPESGARTNDAMLSIMYQEMLPQLDPASPEYAAVARRLMLVSGVDVPKQNPAAQTMAADAAAPQGGQPVPMEGPMETLPPTELPVGVQQ